MRPDELFGSAHQGRMQKRYKHKKDWTVYRGEESVGGIMTDTPNKEEELSQVKESIRKLRGTKAVLRWTATEHFDCEKKEVEI